MAEPRILSRSLSHTSNETPSLSFSTDLDFPGIEEHDHEDVILAMMEALEQAFHGIQFAIPDAGDYETQDGLSWGVNPTYTHEWNQGGSEIRLQISRSFSRS